MGPDIGEPVPLFNGKNIKIAFYIAAAFSVLASPVLTMGAALMLNDVLPLLVSMTSMLFVGAWLICAVAVPAMGAPRIFLWQTTNAPMLINCLKTGIFWAVLIGFPFVLILSSMAEPTISQFFERFSCGMVACILMGNIYALSLYSVYKPVYYFLMKINP